VLRAELKKLGFKRIIAVDTEYWFGVDADGVPIKGNPLRPVCVCAKDLLSNASWELWLDEFPAESPFPLDKTTLIVAFNVSAESGTFKALGWPAPARALDLYAEYCDHQNGRDGDGGRSLLAALSHFGLDSIGATHKQQMIDRILRGPHFTEQERREICDYCWSDVYALERLLPAMLPDIEWKGALIRGRYANAVAAMERAGIPVNIALLNEVVARWSEIQGGLIRRIDQNFGVYDGTTFRSDLFEAYVEKVGIPWPRLPSVRGGLALDADTFGDMARVFPFVAPLAELRNASARCGRMMFPSAKTAEPEPACARSRARHRGINRAHQSSCMALRSGFGISFSRRSAMR